MNIKDSYLKDILNSDLELIFKWRNQEHIRNSMFSTNKIKWEEHCQWHEKCGKDKTREDKIFVYKGKPVGVVSFVDINNEDGKCFWGFYIGTEQKEPGLGKKMACTALDYIFEKYNLKVIIGEVLENNICSINFHEKVGFEYKHLARKIVWQDTLVGVLRFELEKEKWLVIRTSII